MEVLCHLIRIVLFFVLPTFIRSFIIRSLRSPTPLSTCKLQASYIDQQINFRTGEKKCLVGLSTDQWNIGQGKYKELLAAHKLAKRIQQNNIACIELPLWEMTQGPHYDDLQRLLESFWIPDMSSSESLLLQYDLIIIPDPVIAKYIVEAYYEKEAKVSKRKAYYNKLTKQPWGVVEHYPPRERYEFERIRDLSKQRWIRKFPPIAVCGDETYKRIKQHGQVKTSFGHKPSKVLLQTLEVHLK